MNDILITDRMNLDLNNRIVIFHDDDNKIGPSKFHALSSYGNNESFDNYLYLRKYLKKFYYLDFSLKRIIDDSYNFKQNETLFILLEQYNEAIFEEITADDQLNGCHRAIFYLPTLVSSKQKEAILEFKDYFRRFSQIALCNITTNASHSIEQVPFALISGDEIDKLEEFLPVQVEYTKVIRQ